MKHLNNQPEPLEKVRPGLPKDLCRIIHRMLGKRPEDRFADARDLLQALRSLQIQGVSEGWLPSAEEWDTAELLAVSGPQAAATARLADLMRQEPAAQRSWGRMVLWVSAGLVALCGGIMWGIATRPQPLLADAAPATQVEHKGDVWRQLYHAKQRNTVEAWRSVLAYFPEDAAVDGDEARVHRHAGILARQGLLRYYISQSRNPQELRDGLEVVQQLIAAPESWAHDLGYVAKCILLYHLGEYTAAKDAYQMVTDEMILALDAEFSEALEWAMQQTEQALQEQGPNLSVLEAT